MKKQLKNLLLILILVLSLGGLIFSIITVKNSLGNKTEPNKSENINMEEPSEKPGNMEEPPEKPDGEPQEKLENKEMESNINVVDYFVIGVFALTFSLDLIYLILSKFNKLDANSVFKKNSRKLLFIILSLALSGVLVFLAYCIINDCFSKKEVVQEEKNETKISFNGNDTISITTTENEKKYSSETADQNALLVSGEIEVHVNNSTALKKGDSSSGDSTSFYGINSAILAKDKAKLFIDNMTVVTDANGANGVFSFGNNSDGTAITVTNSRITTTGDASGGIMVAGGGKLTATNLDIYTSGKSSAAIRSDRGGGTLNVNLGTYKTTGIGSPAVYSTANVSISSATLISEASEGVIIEGANSVTLNNVDLEDTNNRLNGQSTTYKNIFLYQSMSGDAEEGTATFKAEGSKIITNKGDTFYVTNTKATIELINNKITNNDESGNFLRIQKDSWGKTGSNGGSVTMSLYKQTATGNIVVDSLSTLELALSESSLETTINTKNEAKSISLKLDSKSKIKLTGDSYIKVLDNEDPQNKNIDLNGYKLYVNGEELKGA